MLNIRKQMIAGVVLAVTSLSAGASAQTFYMGTDRDVERGTQALMAGELETASKFLHRAANKDLGAERLVPVLNNLCAVDYALGNLDSAEKSCTRAIAEDRFFWRAYVNRGHVFKAQGNYAGAREDYARAVKMKPESELPKRALARLMQEQPKLLAEAQ